MPCLRSEVRALYSAGGGSGRKVCICSCKIAISHSQLFLELFALISICQCVSGFLPYVLFSAASAVWKGLAGDLCWLDATRNSAAGQFWFLVRKNVLLSIDLDKTDEPLLLNAHGTGEVVCSLAWWRHQDYPGALRHCTVNCWSILCESTIPWGARPMLSWNGSLARLLGRRVAGDYIGTWKLFDV